jgi:hypothetical protein
MCRAQVLSPCQGMCLSRTCPTLHPCASSFLVRVMMPLTCWARWWRWTPANDPQVGTVPKLTSCSNSQTAEACLAILQSGARRQQFDLQQTPMWPIYCGLVIVAAVQTRRTVGLCVQLVRHWRTPTSLQHPLPPQATGCPSHLCARTTPCR